MEQQKNKMNIAIISPAKNAYSETFIQAHKALNKGNVKFYYGNLYDILLEGDELFSNKLLVFWYRLVGKIFQRKGNYLIEKHLLNSWKKHNIKAILVEYGTNAVKYLPILKKANIPFIVHFHGYDASVKKILEANKIEYEILFEQAAYIIAVSRVMEAKLLLLGCAREKLIYNVYGPNDGFFDVQPSYNNNTFVGIGRFVDKKAPYYTILAFKKVVEKYKDAQLILAGEGNLLNMCENLVKHLKIQKNVVFPGKIAPEKYKNHLEKSLGFVQHSITANDGDMEGTPVAIIEASAAGLPVVSTIHAGIPDVILNGETGLLVKEHDVDGMSEFMIKLLDDKEYAKQLGQAGKKRIKENFSMQRHLEILDNLLIRVIENAKSVK
ncbi:MAG: glycosyltransferase [Bacteroidota bacterium]|nr:glycosyltransferase [Bacteroidota bacterium]